MNMKLFRGKNIPLFMENADDSGLPVTCAIDIMDSDDTGIIYLFVEFCQNIFVEP